MSNDENESYTSESKQPPLEWAKKILALGVGAAFLTEEGVRGLVQEFKLPKELFGTLIDGAGKVRKEFIQNFSADLMNKISDKIDPQTFVTEFLKKNELTFEVKLKVKEKQES